MVLENLNLSQFNSYLPSIADVSAYGSSLFGSAQSLFVEHPVVATSGLATGLAALSGVVLAAKNYPKTTLVLAGTLAATAGGVFGAAQYGYINPNMIDDLQLPALRDNLVHAYNSWKNSAPMCESCVVQECPSMYSLITNKFSGLLGK